MRILAREIRLRHNRKADPTMVIIDDQTVKGGRDGPTFHEAGGRGGYTRMEAACVAYLCGRLRVEPT